MNVIRSCEHCGATLAADARFCEKCGKSVASIASPAPATLPPVPSAQTPVAAPAQSNRPPWLIAGCVAIVALFVCVVIALVGGYFFFQPPFGMLATPTRIAISSPSTPALPASPATRAPTSALAVATLTQIPVCPPNPVLPTGVLFNEDFSSRQVAACNEWGFGEIGYGLGNVTWSPNAFTIALTKAAQRIGFGPRVTGEFQDVALETEVQRDNNNVATYGLMFRSSYDQDKKASHYRFIVTSDGKYALTKLVAAAESTLIDLTASSAIKTGQSKNILGVIMRGSTIALYVNRSLLKTVTDDSIRAKGTVSVFVASETNLPATFTVSRFTILTPEKALAEWGSGPASSAPPIVSSSPPTVPPTLAARPGLYVTAVRLDPGPKRGVDIGFYPMFLNTTGGTQKYRVKVYIYRPDNMRNSFGETSAGIITIPVDTTEQSVPGSWKLGGGGGCDDFLIRVGWIDEANRITFFDKPDGNIFESYTSVCP